MQTRKNSLRRFSLFAILLLLLASCAPKLTFVVSIIAAFIAGTFLSVMLVGVGMSFAPSSTTYDESEIKSFSVNDEFPSRG